MWSFAIDRGGTFTDVYAQKENSSDPPIVMKLLSEDPTNYPDAPREAIRRILNENEIVDASNIKNLCMGTTVATNALLERKGEPIALAITKGFSDLLKIGNQARPNIFDLSAKKPDVLYEKVVEIPERIIPKKLDCQLNIDCQVVSAVTGEEFMIEKPLDLSASKNILEGIYFPIV